MDLHLFSKETLVTMINELSHLLTEERKKAEQHAKDLETMPCSVIDDLQIELDKERKRSENLRPELFSHKREQAPGAAKTAKEDQPVVPTSDHLTMDDLWPKDDLKDCAGPSTAQVPDIPFSLQNQVVIRPCDDWTDEDWRMSDRGSRGPDDPD